MAPGRALSARRAHRRQPGAGGSSAWWLSTLAARRSTGPKRERPRSNGFSCHAARSPPTPSPFSFMRWSTTSATSLGRRRCPRRRNRGPISCFEKPIKIGTKVVSDGLYLTFQMTRGRGIAADVRVYLCSTPGCVRHTHQPEGALGSKDADHHGEVHLGALALLCAVADEIRCREEPKARLWPSRTCRLQLLTRRSPACCAIITLEESRCPRVADVANPYCSRGPRWSRYVGRFCGGSISLFVI